MKTEKLRQEGKVENDDDDVRKDSEEENNRNEPTSTQPKLKMPDTATTMTTSQLASATKSPQSTPRTTNDSSSKQQQQRPQSGKGATNAAEYVTCVRPMCEHDEGWHLAESFVPLPNGQQHIDDTYAAYLARVMTIVKTGSIASETHIFFSDAGRKLIAEIDAKASAAAANGDGSIELRDNLAESYTALRTFFTNEADEQRIYSLASAHKGTCQLELEFCELKNGKRVWLCPSHVAKTNATVVRGDSSSGSGLGQLSSIYAKMLEFIQQDDLIDRNG